MNNTAQQTRYKKVLVIDDDKIDLYISSRIMKSALLSEMIEEKSSAREALDYLKNLEARKEELPSVIFLDLGMPVMDGFAFLDEFSQLSDSIKSHCKIIVLTNVLEPDPEVLKKIKNNPLVKKILNKPLTSEALEKI